MSARETRVAPLGAPKPVRSARNTLVRTRRGVASLVRSTPAQVLAEHAVLSALVEFVERQAPSLLASAVSIVLGLMPPGLPSFETWFEPDVEVCRRPEDVFRPSAGGHEFLPSSHHRVLVWTVNGRKLRSPLEDLFGCSAGEFPSLILGPRHVGLFEPAVLTDSRAPDSSERNSVLTPTERDERSAGRFSPRAPRETS